VHVGTATHVREMVATVDDDHVTAKLARSEVAVCTPAG
jgi:hypothetical protein